MLLVSREPRKCIQRQMSLYAARIAGSGMVYIKFLSRSASFIMRMMMLLTVLDSILVYSCVVINYYPTTLGQDPH